MALFSLLQSSPLLRACLRKRPCQLHRADFLEDTSAVCGQRWRHLSVGNPFQLGSVCYRQKALSTSRESRLVTELQYTKGSGPLRRLSGPYRTTSSFFKTQLKSPCFLLNGHTQLKASLSLSSGPVGFPYVCFLSYLLTLMCPT